MKSGITFLLNPQEYWPLLNNMALSKGAGLALCKAVERDGFYEVHFAYEDFTPCLTVLAVLAKKTTSVKKRELYRSLSGKLIGYVGLRGHVREDGREVAVKTQVKTKADVYVFDVEMIHYPEEADVRRMIAIAGTRSLYNLAQLIIDSFGMMFDHCFAFYSDVNAHPSAERAEIYELFVDIGQEPTASHVQGVKKVKISAVFTEVGKTMLFMFDYGDDWRFGVELKEIRKKITGEKLPAVLGKIGNAPPQYPSFEDV
jgi:hypothetical protein